jgi:hypothetical protein
MSAFADQRSEAESQESWLGQPSLEEPSPVYILMYLAGVAEAVGAAVVYVGGEDVVVVATVEGTAVVYAGSEDDDVVVATVEGAVYVGAVVVVVSAVDAGEEYADGELSAWLEVELELVAVDSGAGKVLVTVSMVVRVHCHGPVGWCAGFFSGTDAAVVASASAEVAVEVAVVAEEVSVLDVLVTDPPQVP